MNRYNMRELFELYKREEDHVVIKQLIEDGHRHVATLQSLGCIEKEKLDSVFSFMTVRGKVN